MDYRQKYLQCNINSKKDNDKYRTYYIDSELKNKFNVDQNNLNQFYNLNRVLSKVLDSYLYGTKINMPEEIKLKLFEKLDKNKNSIINFQKGGFIFSDPNASAFTKLLDLGQLILDVAGFAPGIGIPIDITSMFISLGRGDLWGAVFSGINVIPVIGSFIGTPSKYFKKMYSIKKLNKRGRRKSRRKKRKRKRSKKKYIEQANNMYEQYNDTNNDDHSNENYNDDYSEGYNEYN